MIILDNRQDVLDFAEFIRMDCERTELPLVNRLIQTKLIMNAESLPKYFSAREMAKLESLATRYFNYKLSK